MKFLFLLLLPVFFFACGNESKSDKDTVPEAVKAAFAKKYPDEKNAKWGLDRNDNWEAKFKEDGEHYKADFTPDGVWVETETSIKKKDLPKTVENSIKNQFEDYKIVEIEKTDHPTKGLFYDVEFKKNGKKFDVEFAADGRVIGREE